MSTTTPRITLHMKQTLPIIILKRPTKLQVSNLLGSTCLKNLISGRFGLWYATHIPYAQVFDWRKFTDERLRRQFQKLLDNGNSLNAEDSAALSEAQNKMSNIYATGRVGDENRCLRLEAGGTGEVRIPCWAA